jgi:hypothetical protein
VNPSPGSRRRIHTILGVSKTGIVVETARNARMAVRIGHVRFRLVCRGGRLPPAPVGTLAPAVTVSSPAASGAVVTAEIYHAGEIIPAVSRDYFRGKHNYRDNGRPTDGGRDASGGCDASGWSCVCDRRASQDVSCHVPAAHNRLHGLNQRRGLSRTAMRVLIGGRRPAAGSRRFGLRSRGGPARRDPTFSRLSGRVTLITLRPRSVQASNSHPL